MTKDVMLVINGIQNAIEQEGDSVETITPANYYFKNGSHYVIYDEVSEGNDRVTKGILKFKENYLEVTKNGEHNIHMLFENSQKNLSNFATPFGNFIIGVETDSMDMQIEENKISINVGYELDLNYEHIAACNIKIDIHAKGSAESLLQDS